MSTDAEKGCLENLQLALWLSVTYAACPEVTEKVGLDDIHHNIKLDFESLQMACPSKFYISLVIKELFKAGKTRKMVNGDVRMLYSNIKKRSVQRDYIFPNHFSVSKNENDELVLALPTLFMINDVPATINLTFSKDVVLSSNGKRVQLPISGRLNRELFEGWVFFLESVQLCKGVLTDVIDAPKGSINEKWIPISRASEGQYRTRCKMCLTFIHSTSNCDHCRSCKLAFHRKLNRKRKPLASIENISTPQTSGTPAQSESGNTVQLAESDHQELMDIVDRVVKIGAPEKFQLLLKDQLKNGRQSVPPQGRRWDPDVISLCLGIYCRSPSTYRDISKSGMLVLPSQRLLRYYKNSVRQTPGLNEDNLTWMAKEAERQNISGFGRRGGILIDEMSIQQNLEFTRNGNEWKLVGCKDMGGVNNQIQTILSGGKEEVRLATHALQYVFHGYSGFRWPVCYFGSATASAYQLMTNFWDLVDKLDDHGFKVEYIMFDGASTNRTFSSLMFPKGTVLRDKKYITPNIFNLSASICVIQDIMHVLKKIRNNVEASRKANKSSSGRYLQLNGKAILWEHWLGAHDFNEKSGMRIHHKLTNDHFELTSASKMRNHLATQVLDSDMLYLMTCYRQSLPCPAALDFSIDLLKHTSIMVQVFSDRKAIVSPEDPRLGKLQECLGWFHSWERTIESDKLQIPTKHLITRETRQDIDSCLLGFQSLCNYVLDGTQSVVPCYFNSDLIENTFCQQRGVRNGLNSNPTLKQYGPACTAIVLTQTTVSTKSNSGTKALNYGAVAGRALNQKKKKLGV